MLCLVYHPPFSSRGLLVAAARSASAPSRARMSGRRGVFEAPTTAPPTRAAHAAAHAAATRVAQCAPQCAAQPSEPQLVDAATAPEARTCSLCLESNADSFFCAADGAPCWQSGEEHHWYCKPCLIALCARRGPVCVGCRKELGHVFTLGDAAAEPVPREFRGERCRVCGSAQAVAPNVLIVCECANCTRAPAPLRKAIHLFCTGRGGGAHWRAVPKGRVFHIEHAPTRLERVDRVFEDALSDEEPDALSDEEPDLSELQIAGEVRAAPAHDAPFERSGAAAKNWRMHLVEERARCLREGRPLSAEVAAGLADARLWPHLRR